MNKGFFELVLSCESEKMSGIWIAFLLAQELT
jgi:hypothetical protein